MCSLSAYSQILFEKCDLFVDDNEAPPPDPFDNVYDDNSLPSIHAPYDSPNTADGLASLFKLEEFLLEFFSKGCELLGISSAPVPARIIFEKRELEVDDNEAPPPDPFDNVYDDNSLPSIHAPHDLTNTVEGLAPPVELARVKTWIISKELEHNVVKLEMPLLDFFDSIDDVNSFRLPFKKKDGLKEKKFQCILKGLPNGMSVQDFSETIDLPNLLISVLHFIKQTGKGPPTHITVNISPVTSRIIFEKGQLDVDDNEAPPPQPFDLVKQCDDRGDSSHGTNKAKEGVSWLGNVSDGGAPEEGKHKGTSEESVEDQKKSKKQKHRGTERKGHTTDVEENEQGPRRKRIRQETISAVASEGAEDNQATKALKVESSLPLAHENSETRTANIKTASWDYIKHKGHKTIDQFHNLTELCQQLPCLGWQGVGPGFRWALGEVLWDTRRASSLNEEVNDLGSRHDRTEYTWNLQQVSDYSQAALVASSLDRPRQKLSNLSISLYSQYEQTGVIGYLHQAIEYNQEALEATPLGHNNRATCLNNQSVYLSSRYERTGAIGDLDQAIKYSQEALQARPIDHNDRAACLNTLANCLNSRYERTGAIGDLDQAIEYSQEALAAAPPSHNNRVTLNNLANQLKSRYQWTGAIGDLDQAIKYSQEALQATPRGHNNRAACLINLANKLNSRYERRGAIGDLDQAIEYSQEALAAAPIGHKNRATCLNNLASFLSSRYEWTGAIGDVDQAIKYSQEALQARPIDHNDQAACLNNLANCLNSRYERTGAIGDLDQVIEYSQDALAATPIGHNNRVGCLNNLASSLISRYEQKGAIGDLDQAIKYSQDALQATPPGHNDRAIYLKNQSVGLNSRYERIGAIGDLDQAIEYSQEALAAAPIGHKNRASCLNNLANKLNSRYERTGAIGDLDQAIEYSQEALAATPPGHNNRASCLNNLANRLNFRYKRTGAIGDLDQAIKYSQEALQARPIDNNNRAGNLHNLANHLNVRYERTGATGDLYQAIEYSQEALEATPPGHDDRASRLGNLAGHLNFKYGRTGAIQDLHQAIEYSQEALAATPPGHNDRAGYLQNLASHLKSRYERTGATRDLDQAIEYSQEALQATPLGHNDRAGLLCNLAIHFNFRYEWVGAMGDFDQAIKYIQEALAAVPRDHPDRGPFLNATSTLFLKKFLITRGAANFDNSIHLLEESWGSTTLTPSNLISIAGLFFIALYMYPQSGTPCFPTTQQLGEPYTPASSPLFQKSFMILEAAVLQLPRVSPRILERQDQQFNLLNSGSIAESAASCALIAGKATADALTLLELSRGIIMGFAIDCRGDLSELKITYPELCQKFIDLRTLIDTPPHQTYDSIIGGSSDTQSSGNAEARDKHRTYANERREKAVCEMETTIAKIRELPGHEGFQLPPPPNQLMSMAKHGPIVVFISTRLQSDAIIVTSSTINSITLPELHYSDIPRQLGKITGLTKGKRSNYIARNKTMQEILCWLWNVAVEPVVRELELTVKSARDPDLAHIWWIGVGNLSMAPFHAAGDYSNSDPRQNILSYAVSSYTPTIKALSYARERDFTFANGKPDPKLLLITMEKTPGLARLSDVVKEVEEIVQVTDGSIVTKHLAQPSAQIVLDELAHGSFEAIHFACHGVTNDRDPSSSHLVLLKAGKDGEAGEVDELTVEKISGRMIGGAQLAYLSACSTAKNRNLRLANETIHIASGFQLAGFNHVIATMWSSESAVCREVSQDFYRLLFDGNGDSDGHKKVRIALHGAVKRAQEKYPHNPLKWAPFIHMGA